MLIFVKKSTVSYRKWEYGRCLYMTRGRQYGPASVMCGDGEMLPTAVYLAVEGAAHLVEHDVLCVEGTHEAEGDGLAVGEERLACTCGAEEHEGADGAICS